jgi:hypothetical protein
MKQSPRKKTGKQNLSADWPDCSDWYQVADTERPHQAFLYEYAAFGVMPKPPWLLAFIADGILSRGKTAL